jgi:outer membrane biosynthesis protein TonB
MQKHVLLALLYAVSLGTAGCANKRIVRAAPPSVSEPPPLAQDARPMPQPETPPPATPAEEQPAPEVTPPEPPPAPAKRPVAPKPRPAPSETEPAPPKPAPPQISPQLSPRDLETARKNTTDNITVAENNLQRANGRQLSAAQKDLADKISSFLKQSHEAITADDWVRAQNLAEKARVLSTELVKSF